MTAKIFEFGKDNDAIKVCEACEEAAQIIEAEMVRWSQQYTESHNLTLTNVGVDALEQMAAWSIARLAEQSSSEARNFALRLIKDINREYGND